MNYAKTLIAALLGAAIIVTYTGCGIAESSDSAANMTMSAGSGSGATSINWYRNVEEANAEATERGTIIMVDVYTDWCHWCKELDKNVFTDQSVIDLSTKIVNLKVNAEDNREGTALARKFGVQGYPTILFITADGREVDRIGGYLPPEDFAAEMGKIISGEGTYLSYSKALDTGSLDATKNVDALAKFMDRQDHERVKKIAEGLDPASIASDEAREKAYLLLTDYNFANKNFEKAENLLIDFINAFPQSETVPRAYLFIVIANIYQNDIADAKKYLEILKEKYPGEQQLIAQAEKMISQAG